ncbi:MAG: FixH family protein [Cyclobacteriaceae bacterium]
MNWGYRIVFSFVLFIGLIITLVVISMNQDVNLVAEDYYNQEIAYQDQIERIKRTSELDRQPSGTYDNNLGQITIDVFSDAVDSGSIHFFRPSDANQDKQVAFPESGTGKVVVPVKGWLNGLWKVKVQWSVSGEEFYAEKVVTI